MTLTIFLLRLVSSSLLLQFHLLYSNETWNEVLCTFILNLYCLINYSYKYHS